MPPKRFEGKFGIPPSHPVESLLTQALYRLPDSVPPEQIERMTNDIVNRVNTERNNKGQEILSEEELYTLQLKLARHFEDNGDSAPADIPTLVDALIESPKFLQSDKGSITKLFDLHEMKTLQKIAELRRKKAEQTSNEGFNPYENLFETSSGNYYLARLLNMPHLEDESAYMKHCVGTSTSYISKIKRGEVEIFSLRNKVTHEPVVTIEYDCRLKYLSQVAAQHDRLPTLADEFFKDLIEAIELLGKTINDKNENRKVITPEVVDLRHLLDLTDKHSRNEPLTKDELAFLYEVDKPITAIGYESLIEKLHKDRNVEEDMLTIFGCTKEQIAHAPSEITENTKAYVGQLEPGIFQKLPETLEHVYTSFPENKIRRATVEIGGKSKEQLLDEMKASGIHFLSSLESTMDNPGFIIGTKREKVTLIRLRVSDLGFKTDATINQIYERAQALGLELCPPDTGPNYRLQYKDQPRGQGSKEWVCVGMKKIPNEDGYPSIFILQCLGVGLWLDTTDRGTTTCLPWTFFVFRFRKVET